MAPNHSVRRLLNVISTLQETAEERGATSASLIEVIALTNGLDMGDPTVLGRTAAIFELPRRVVRDMNAVDAEQYRHAGRGLKTLTELLSPKNMHRMWSGLYNEIDEKGLPALAICSLILDTRPTENALDRAELGTIADEARQLLADIRSSSNLAPDVAAFVESALVDLLTAIDEYWLKGAAVVEDAVDRAVGRAIREKHFEHKDKSTQGVMKRLGTILTRVAVVVAVANDMHSLPETVRDVVHGVVEIVTDITTQPVHPSLPEISVPTDTPQPEPSDK